MRTGDPLPAKLGPCGLSVGVLLVIGGACSTNKNGEARGKQVAVLEAVCGKPPIGCPLSIGCTVTSPFGRARWHEVLKEYRDHNGVDYKAPPGTPVRAAADGVVVRSYNSDSYGQTIIVQHDGSKFGTLYAHLNERRVSEKDPPERVRRGQVIGLSGDTGKDVTGPHLHFEYLGNPRDLTNRRAIDPVPCVQNEPPDAGTGGAGGNGSDGGAGGDDAGAGGSDGGTCTVSACSCGKVPDTDACDCVCPPGTNACNGECFDTTCTGGRVFVASDCRCACPSSAPIWNPSLQACESCPEFTTWNPVTQQCISNATVHACDIRPATEHFYAQSYDQAQIACREDQERSLEDGPGPYGPYIRSCLANDLMPNYGRFAFYSQKIGEDFDPCRIWWYPYPEGSCPAGQVYLGPPPGRCVGVCQ